MNKIIKVTSCYASHLSGHIENDFKIVCVDKKLNNFTQ